MITVTISPAGRGRFDAYADGRYLITSTSPLADAARVLAAQGVDPATPVALVYAGSDTIALRSTIGIAAGVVVEEAVL